MSKLLVRIVWIVFFAYIVISACMVEWRFYTADRYFLDDEQHFNATLAQILRPRAAGSLGHAQVIDYLEEELRQLGFMPHYHESFHEMYLCNIVGVLNVDASHYLALSCHYDTIDLADVENYVGATDGAVSCAILLNVAKILGPYLLGEFTKRRDIGLMLLFFDGHEPLRGSNESGLHGSRQFVEDAAVPLKAIQVLITLNLIGAPRQSYMSKHYSTFRLHKRMADIEVELMRAGLITKNYRLFHKLMDYGMDIEDDHFPFLDKGRTPVLHVAPQDYPKVWHTADDNVEHLHWPTVRNMNAIIRRFVHEYLKQTLT